jgi:TolB-like protein
LGASNVGLSRRKGFQTRRFFALDLPVIPIRNRTWPKLLVKFNNFTLDTDRRELKGAEGAIHVEPQVFDLLFYFAQNTNRVIGKDELIEHVWKGRIVSDAALNSRINSARRAIGETGEKQTLIRTVPRRGFLFAGDVQIPTHNQGPSPTTVEAPVEQSKLALPDKPSIAVLPFVNLSGDPEQEYFADGVVEDIITGLSRIKWLFVIARNSSFAYKGRVLDVKQVGRDLGVRYVLEGSLRKAGERVRISVQLIEAETGGHLWAERYDRRLEDIFALQDEITLSVIGAIEPSLRDAEIERVRRKRPDSLDAYDLVLRAFPHAVVAMPEEAAKALPLLEQALALEADYAGAHAMLAWCHQILFMRAGFTEENRTSAIRHARAAVDQGRDDATALALGAFVIGLLGFDRVAALEAFERALALSPSSAFALFFGSIILGYAGEAERAIDWGERALRVSPFDRLAFLPKHAIAIAHFQRGRYEEAADATRRAVQSNPSLSVTQSWLVAALVKLGRVDDAKAAAKRLLVLQPSFSAGKFCAAIDMVPALAKTLTEAWREAGLPP